VFPASRGLNVISLADGGKSNLLSRIANTRSPRLSPDGKWLAYASLEMLGALLSEQQSEAPERLTEPVEASV
jgi:hypothetical protein